MTEKFLGVPYPITKHARGYFRTQSGVNQIKSDLLVLILTNQGERVMLPEFGANLRRFLFEPNDEILRLEVRNAIIQAIELWEPRVVIEQVEVTSNPDMADLDSDQDPDDREHVLLIKIRFFDPENIQEVDELRLEVPLLGN